MASVFILHFERLVRDGSVSFVEATQKAVRLDGIAIKEDEQTLAEHNSFILSNYPEPALGQPWRRHRYHPLACGGLKYICMEIYFKRPGVWRCITAHVCMMALSEDLIDFDVTLTRQKKPIQAPV